jgi:uncharacterized protein YlxW (UPF0749 family)
MFATFWKWIRIIGGIVIAVGTAIVALVFLRDKGKKTVEDTREVETEGRITQGLAEAARLEQERKDKEAQIAKTAEDAKKKLEESQNKPEKPGDVGKVADDLTKNW